MVKMKRICACVALVAFGAIIGYFVNFEERRLLIDRNDQLMHELVDHHSIMSKYNDLIHRIWIDRPTYVEEILTESREFAEWDETVGENWKDGIFSLHNSDDSLAYYNNWDSPDRY